MFSIYSTENCTFTNIFVKASPPGGDIIDKISSVQI